MFKEFCTGKIFIIIVILLINSNFLPAQQNIDLDNQFKLAVSLYQSGEYNSALSIFKKIAVESAFNPKTTVAYLFIGKTYLGMNDL